MARIGGDAAGRGGSGTSSPSRGRRTWRPRGSATSRTTSAGRCGRCGWKATTGGGSHEPRRWPPAWPITCGPSANGSPFRPCNGDRTLPDFQVLGNDAFGNTLNARYTGLAFLSGFRFSYHEYTKGNKNPHVHDSHGPSTPVPVVPQDAFNLATDRRNRHETHACDTAVPARSRRGTSHNHDRRTDGMDRAEQAALPDTASDAGR